MSTKAANPNASGRISTSEYLSWWGVKFQAFARKHKMELPHMGLIREQVAKDLELKDENQEVELHADGRLTSDGETIFNL